MSVRTTTTTIGHAAHAVAPEMEAVMANAIPTQHPAVVLRSHYRQLRALLAVAMIAVTGLTAAVVILATDHNRTTSAGPATQLNAPSAASGSYNGSREAGIRATAPAQPASATRFDGGPEEGTRGTALSQPASATRFDGGPEEGTRGTALSQPASATRFDGGPEEGSRGSAR